MHHKADDKTYRYTVLAMGFLEKVLGSKITVEGLETIPEKPVLFVCNHFTRSETFVVPYIIYKHTKRQVRCLADSGLFHGMLGRFLKSVGAISTKDPKRDKIIVSDLVQGKYDWMIYPEGEMVKSKEIYSNNFSYLLGRVGNNTQNRVRTGSAVLALKSELYRTELVSAKLKDRSDILDYYQDEFGIKFDEKLVKTNTQIVPVNITYYPIRPGKNIIQKVIARFVKAIPKEISEELEIEGNLLLSSDMNIHFGKAIDLQEYTKRARGLIYPIPVIDGNAKANMALKYLKYRLTNRFMKDIYTNTKINIDHIVAAILFLYPKDKICINHFKSLVYLSVCHINILRKYRINEDIKEQNLFKLLVKEDFLEFSSVIDLAISSGIINQNIDKDSYFIDKNRIGQKFGFQQIRIENTLQVILNEFLLLNSAVSVVKRNVSLGEEDVRKRNSGYIISKDLECFKRDYKKYYDKNLSKPEYIGKPVFRDNSKSNKGILLVHGYLSAPKEMEEMAKYFNKSGFKTYAVRLKGHGTAPINLEDVSWQDWCDSLNRGYAALQLICDQVFIVGFSTGGLLSLMSAFNKNNQVDGIAIINPAFKLKDVRAKFSSGVRMWNDILEKINIEKWQLRFVENNSESPENNYCLNYIVGVGQLGLLMEKCEDILPQITCPVLVIQSTEDPVIDFSSSKSTLKKINSKDLSFTQINSTKHTIIKGVGSEEVFVVANNFFTKLIKK
ncbi:MAG: esterase/lipase/1-acyl-sn-glycerol-3-phosphate acyltransferase [Rickettsiales bacterium]|jgi:esterase/lipase/1-acyl-sn-glycerol-3-phosphate acyltransferase